MEVVGLDIGFGFTKVANGRKSLVFKSVFGEATDLQFNEQVVSVPDDEHLHVEIDGSAFFVGELAEQQSKMRYFTLDQGQFVSRFARTLALAALARVVERNVPVKLVTGLPVGHYTRYKDELARLLQGRHEVVLVDAKGNREETVVAIQQVRVIPQPFGSMFNRMLNDTGEAAEARLAREKIGIIDIGFRTADYVIAASKNYLGRGSRTTDSGISQAFSTIAARLHERSGVDVELYRLYRGIDEGSIKIRGKSYDLKKITEQVFGQLAADVANEVNQLWTDDWDMDAMLITGGGGRALAPYLQPLLNGHVLPDSGEGDARLSNVNGYRKYASYLWARGREAALNG